MQMKEKKLRAELLGENSVIEPFCKWALRVIIEPAIRKYNELRLKSEGLSLIGGVW